MPYDIIQSPSNPNFKIFKSLLSSRGIKKEGLCLVSGQKIVSELTSNPFVKVSALIFKDKMAGAYLEENHKKYIFNSDLFKQLDIFNSESFLAAIHTPITPLADLSLPPVGLEILCPLGDPNNLGALIRSATAFNAKIIMLQEASNPFLPKTINASSGAVFYSDIQTGPSISKLSTCHSLYTLDSRGQDILSFKWPENLRLLIGEEGPGLKDLDCSPTQALSISTNKVESLNATVAASIAMYSHKGYYFKK